MNNGTLLKSKPLFLSPTSLFHSNYKTHHSFFSIHLPNHKSLSIHVKIPSASPLFASKSPKDSETSMLRTEEFELEDEFDGEFDEEEDDEDEEIIVPLRNMREWTRNKPKGFGEGKVYDTSIEDKLMEELEKARAAQLVNVNNLKNNNEDGNPNVKKGKLPKQKVPEVVPNGVRVRLVNLPKKKNIHRDLQAAFKPFSGITNIIPAVSGNEKTREPVCKGFAFVDFKSETQAKRFVNTFSIQPITFGKVQKQIRCEIMKLSSPNPNPTSVRPSIDSIRRTENPTPVSNPSVAVNLNPAIEAPFDPYVEDAAFDKLENTDDDDYNNEKVEYFHNMVQEKHEPETGPKSSKKQKKVEEKGKKMTTAKRKTENTNKVNTLGSANRLKMKEKALLSGVFSRYGVKSTMATKGTEVITD